MFNFLFGLIVGYAVCYFFGAFIRDAIAAVLKKKDPNA